MQLHRNLVISIKRDIITLCKHQRHERIFLREKGKYIALFFFCINILKSDSHLLKKCIIYFIEGPLKMMKNAFYFILEELFILKIFKFLS